MQPANTIVKIASTRDVVAVRKPCIIPVTRSPIVKNNPTMDAVDNTW